MGKWPIQPNMSKNNYLHYRRLILKIFGMKPSQSNWTSKMKDLETFTIISYTLFRTAEGKVEIRKHFAFQ